MTEVKQAGDSRHRVGTAQRRILLHPHPSPGPCQAPQPATLMLTLPLLFSMMLLAALAMLGSYRRGTQRQPTA